jgi:hypothetical protein
MKRFCLIISLIFLTFFTSCATQDNNPKSALNSTVNHIKNKKDVYPKNKGQVENKEEPSGKSTETSNINNIIEKEEKSDASKITPDFSEKKPVGNKAEPSDKPTKTETNNVIGEVEKSDTSIISQNSSEETFNTEEIKTKEFGFIESIESKLNKDNVAQDVKDYETALRKLNYLDINSVSEAIDIFKKYASEEKKVNDDLYDLFVDYICAMRDFYYDDQVQESYTSRYSTDDYIKNGFMFLQNEDIEELEVDTTFLYNTFKPYLSEGLNGLNYIYSEEQIQAGDTYYIMDMALWISWDQLAERLIMREEYYKKYKDTDFKEQAIDLKEFNDVYLRIYTCEAIIDNTPPYEYPDNRLEEELLNSYKKFMQEHMDSEYYQTIKKIYEVFEQNDFTYNDEVMNDVYIAIFGKRFWRE